MKTLQRAVYEEQLCDSILESRYSDLEKVSEELTNAFWRREVHPGKLCRAAVHILQEDTKFGNLLESSWQTDLDTFAKQFSYKTVVQFLVKPLFQALLRTSFVRDVRVEKLLTYARSMYLDKAINSHDIFDDVDHKGVTALACNAYFSGYIFYESAKDSLNVEILIYNLEANTNEHLDAFLVALVACFRPLNSLKFRDRIKTAPWFGNDEFMRDVLKLQIENTEREFELSQTIIEATPIEKGVSAQVKAQYEESPYPPWTNFVRSGPIPPNELLNSAGFRFNGERFGNRDEIDVLVAGCGTGSTAIFIATAWTRARVTGLDLSRASLSYAMRCAEELGVSGIRFVQGDILRISELKQNFDYIDCSGVLHHLENPIEGLRSLVEICRPGGEIFNTDQGSQFTSFEVTGRLKEAGITISMDGRGRCMDNIFIERLWRSLKYEAVHLHELTDGFHAERVIEWIGFYNSAGPIRRSEAKRRRKPTRLGHRLTRSMSLWRDAEPHSSPTIQQEISPLSSYCPTDNS